MLIVKTEGKKIENALKEFKRKVDRTKTMKKYRSKMEYEKPSVKKRNSKRTAIRTQKYILNNNDESNNI